MVWTWTDGPNKSETYISDYIYYKFKYVLGYRRSKKKDTFINKLHVKYIFRGGPSVHVHTIMDMNIVYSSFRGGPSAPIPC